MHSGRTVLAQFLAFLPARHFEYLVDKYAANHWCHDFSAWSQFVCMAYAQLSRREGLRDLVACLNSQAPKLYHLGLRQRVARSTLADANEKRSCVLFESLAQRLVQMALDKYAAEPHVLGLQERLFAMDATVIDLCLNLFPWARFRSTKSGIKLHTVLDLRGAIPVVLTISEARSADSSQLDWVHLPGGSIVVLDRGYVDFARLYALVQRGCSFVVRARSDLVWRCVDNHPVDTTLGVRSDQTIALSGAKSRSHYPQSLRRVRFFDQHTLLELVFLTNRLDLPAHIVAAIYKQRWQVELFFKWLKQNLCIKHFFGNSLNAVKTQIWIAVCVYLLALIARKALCPQLELRTFLHVLEANLFEKVPLQELLACATGAVQQSNDSVQSELF